MHLKTLIDAYGQACRRDGSPAWESAEGKALAHALAAPALPHAAPMPDVSPYVHLLMDKYHMRDGDYLYRLMREYGQACRKQAIEAPPLAAPVTDDMLQAGIKALLKCAASDLESLSPSMHETYAADVTRVYTAMAAGRAAGVDPAVPVPSWISVNERLPEIGRTPVLVTVAWRKYYENEDGSPTYSEGIDVTEGEYVPGFCDRAGYMESYQGTHGDSSAVTHWMPLPQPPAAAA